MFDRLDKVVGPLEDKDIEEVRGLLGNVSLLKMLREIVNEANDRAAQMASMDLVTEEGRARALKQQGFVAGMRRALELIEEKCNG